MITQITFAVLVERIKRFLSNGWPDIADNYTSNEIILYIYESLAAVIVNSSKESYKVDGVHSAPEGFITNFAFDTANLSRDTKTGYFYTTLPSAPVNLDLGYSILSPVFVGNSSESYPVIWIQSYQRGYAKKLPTPNFGVYAFVQNKILYLDTNGINIKDSGLTLNVPMLTSRGATGAESDVINAPDDAIDFVFRDVIDKITGRVDRPKMLVNAGNSVPTAK